MKRNIEGLALRRFESGDSVRKSVRYAERMRLALLVLLTCAPAWMQQDALPALGTEAGSLQLRTLEGKVLDLDVLTQSGPALIVVLYKASAIDACQYASKLKGIATDEAMERVAVITGGPEGWPECASAAGVHIARAEFAAQAEDLAQALIVDDSIHVRFRSSVEYGDAGWLAMREGVARWFQGRQTYEANCGHCHGFDGAQASAPETKSLVGITRKYPDAKVLELGAQFGGVDMTGWSGAKKETLLTYLRGL